MTLHEEIEQEKRSTTKQTAWICFFSGILMLLIGLVLVFGNNFHDFIIHGVSSRYSPGMHDEVYTSPKRAGIAVFIISFFFFLISYGSFKKMKLKKNLDSKN